MPESARKRKQTVAELPKKDPPEITDQQVEEILFPELSQDKFNIGRRVFRIRALPWKWEKRFRIAAMPIVEAEFKPFERVVTMYQTDLHLVKEDLGLVESISSSEMIVDTHLSRCVAVICMSQDEELMKYAMTGTETPVTAEAEREQYFVNLIENDESMAGHARKYLREIITRQMEKQRLLQTLGESLTTRFGELAKLVGMTKEYDSLKQTYTQQAQELLGKVGKAGGISANSISRSTPSGSPKATPLPEPKKDTEIPATPTTEVEVDIDLKTSATADASVAQSRPA